jgi:bifunctional polynucleotide phosphatase/kinase
MQRMERMPSNTKLRIIPIRRKPQTLSKPSDPSDPSNPSNPSDPSDPLNLSNFSTRQATAVTEAVTEDKAATDAKATKTREIQQRESCYFWPFIDHVEKGNIYAFDLDGTLVKPLSGGKFAQDDKDWQFWHANVPTLLMELLKDNGSIIIITNQKGVSSGKTKISDIFSKISNFIETISKLSSKALDCERFSVYVATDDDRYRKPYTGIWELINENTPLCKDRVKYYCGDACGRSQDHSSSDRYFAENIGLPFFTPEEIFINSSLKPIVTEKYPAQAFLNMPEYSLKTYQKNFNDLCSRLAQTPKTVCIMVGSPGSGKSSLARALTKHFNDLKSDSAIHVERDSLGGVQKRFLSQIEIALGKGNKNNNFQYIFADATHPNSESRRELMSLIENVLYIEWKVLIIHTETPIALSQHLDACRVQLKITKKTIPIVVFRTFYKKFREDISSDNQKGSWITFTGVNPQLGLLPEYQYHY